MYKKLPTKYINVTCPRCNNIIGYDDDSHLEEFSRVNCPYCRQWFDTSDANVERVMIDVPDYGQFV